MTEDLPIWLAIYTRRVLHPFLSALARSHKWQKLYLISPWISCFGQEAGLTFEQLLKRVKDDNATIYLVSRPPDQPWHQEAIDRIAETGNANIKLLPGLHTKLLVAATSQADFALFGSANFTQRSLVNREIGAMVYGIREGKPIVKSLGLEAADVYRNRDAKIYCLRKF